MRWSRFPIAFPFRFGRGPEVAAEVRAAIEAAENEAEIVEQQAQDDARANALETVMTGGPRGHREYRLDDARDLAAALLAAADLAERDQ